MLKGRGGSEDSHESFFRGFWIIIEQFTQVDPWVNMHFEFLSFHIYKQTAHRFCQQRRQL